MTSSTPTVLIDRPGVAGTPRPLGATRVFKLILISTVMLAASTNACGADAPPHSVARQWNEALLEAIRNDFARPIVHARNLFHGSAAMWDGWAAFDANADPVFHRESMDTSNPQAAREEAISYASFRLLSHRFAASPGNDPGDPGNPENTLNRFRTLMNELGYDPNFNDASANTPAGLGIRIANTLIAHGLQDGANETNGYTNTVYAPTNGPLDLDESGNPGMIAPSRWQPLQRDEGFVDQSGNEVGQAQTFLGAEWGQVTPFALSATDLALYPDGASGYDWRVYLDPGVPPQLGGAEDARFKQDMAEVIALSSELDPTRAPGNGWIDISPASLGNNSLGNNDGNGYAVNPHTGQPYVPQMVLLGDYSRVISEYWADGPASETPPGHWFTIINQFVHDAADNNRRLGGTGDPLPPLEWDVKSYLALGGAVHDAAITSWGIKGYHDGVRPISAIRHMAELGQSSEPLGPAYHPDGLPLTPDLIEVITVESAAGKHVHLSDHVGEIAILAWQGHGHDTETEISGVGWILAKDWWPYQQQGFVTPPFAGYVSGHSTFSRAAAAVLTQLTGDAYFPGGLAEFCVGADEFLEFERGPSMNLCLQWARYFDASDQSGLSRIYGGIHPAYDDLPGRIIGQTMGEDAWARANQYFNGAVSRIFRDSFTQAADRRRAP